jgi:uridylate kinase
MFPFLFSINNYMLEEVMSDRQIYKSIIKEIAYVATGKRSCQMKHIKISCKGDKVIYEADGAMAIKVSSDAVAILMAERLNQDLVGFEQKFAQLIYEIQL